MGVDKTKLAVGLGLPFPRACGIVLEALRTVADVRQSDMARAVGLTQSSWSKVEAGQTCLRVDQFARAAAFLGQAPSQMMTLVEAAAVGGVDALFAAVTWPMLERYARLSRGPKRKRKNARGQ